MYEYQINGITYFSGNREYAMGRANTAVKPKRIKMAALKSFEKLKELRNKMRRQK